MIESGSHTPGVSVADFGLPAGTAIRYERPDPRLANLLTGYAVLDSDPTVFSRPGSWMLPSWAQIWIVLTDKPVGVTIRKRRYGTLGDAILYGVTSQAMPVTAQGGVTVAVEVSPIGWARFVAASAEALRDRITPLAEILPPAEVERLVAALHRSDRDRAVKSILDEFFLRNLPTAHPKEEAVERLWTLIADGTIHEAAGAAARLGITDRALLHLSKRYFGFPPKLLLMRSRFMRAFKKVMLADDTTGDAGVPPGYHDIPHFLRDADRFLGMTPRRFLAMDMPYLYAALRARRLVFGRDQD